MPSWLILLAAFNQELTGIPWVVGLAMATLLATIITVVADRVAFGSDRRRPFGWFARGIVIWSVVFVVLAVAVSAGGVGGVAVVLIPFLGASAVACVVELARQALGRR